MTQIVLPLRYEKTTINKSGGFGNVLICNDNHLDRLVAVKTLIKPSDHKRMTDEISALLKLRSKHVVQLYDIIDNGGSDLAIVEEYIDGPDLIDCADNITTLKDLISILWQISCGIADIHKHDIVHRDVKPNNLKIDAEGIVKIFDFGLSRSIEDAATVGFIGTLIYAAPELYSPGKDIYFTTAVDVFAFSVTAMCLSGVPLPQEMKTYIKDIPSNPFKNSKIKLPSPIEEILFRCLESSPKDRPSMIEIRDELARYLLQDTHKAFMVHRRNEHTLDKANKKVTLRRGGVGELDVNYDGFEFYISRIEGEVTVNNRKPDINEILPHSCVIVIGASHRRNNERSFITFDISHPEVLL